MRKISPERFCDVMMSIIIITLICLTVRACVNRNVQGAECYVYGAPVNSAWRYTQHPMRECSFCTGKVNLNRHHIISQLAAPELANEPTNIIVLCRSCHLVLGHKNNWKKFNPSVREICDRYGGPPVDSRLWRESH